MKLNHHAKYFISLALLSSCDGTSFRSFDLNRTGQHSSPVDTDGESDGEEPPWSAGSWRYTFKEAKLYFKPKHTNPRATNWVARIFLGLNPAYEVRSGMPGYQGALVTISVPKFSLPEDDSSNTVAVYVESWDKSAAAGSLKDFEQFDGLAKCDDTNEALVEARGARQLDALLFFKCTKQKFNETTGACRSIKAGASGSP